MIRFLLKRVSWLPSAAMAVLASASTTFAAPITTAQADISLSIVPTAQIEIIGTPLLYLEVPPATSTIPSNGVNFRVSGNAHAAVAAEPDAFLVVPTPEYPIGEHMGRAVLNGNPLGYRLRLDFPAAGMPGSPAAFAGLPGFLDGQTAPPLAVDLVPTGGSRNGRLHLEASADWTPTGALPLPGIYVGSVTLTVTAY